MITSWSWIKLSTNLCFKLFFTYYGSFRKLTPTWISCLRTQISIVLVSVVVVVVVTKRIDEFDIQYDKNNLSKFELDTHFFYTLFSYVLRFSHKTNAYVRQVAFRCFYAYVRRKLININLGPKAQMAGEWGSRPRRCWILNMCNGGNIDINLRLGLIKMVGSWRKLVP